jgi:molybdopterin converting factor small subunit
MEITATFKLTGNLVSSGKEMSETGGRANQFVITAPILLKEAILRIEDKCKIKINRDSVLILVNGTEANALDDLETVINAQDEVVLVPMFHGG